MQTSTPRKRLRCTASGIALAAVVAALAAGASAAPPDTAAEPAVADGAALFADHCAVCHGRFGEGDGVITPSLAVVLQDLRYLTARNDGEFPRDFIIEIVDGRAVRAAHGPEGMPVWGAEFARDEPLDEQTERRVAARIDALADFLESIQITAERTP